MQQCKIAVFENPEQGIIIQETAIPELKLGEILVKNDYTTLCRSDILTYTGKRKEKSPTILGHEITGKIDAFGPDAIQTDLRGNILTIGDRVTWAIYASDPSSDFSKLGIPQKSPDLFKYGHEQITTESNLHGGLSEYTILRKFTPIIKINKDISPKVIALINCSVATVAGALRMASDINGKNVLITGAGMLGVIACAMSKSAGAHVIAADNNQERLNMSKEFGASITCLMNNSSISFKDLYESENAEPLPPIHVMIDFSGSPQAMEQTLDALHIGGTAVWIGATYPQPAVPVNAEKMVRKIWTIKGLHNYNETDFIHAVEFMENNYLQFPFEKMIHDGFSLDEADEAFKYAIDKNPFRVGVHI